MAHVFERVHRLLLDPFGAVERVRGAEQIVRRGFKQIAENAKNMADVLGCFREAANDFQSERGVQLVVQEFAFDAA